jgi:hypothetical protein
MRTTLNLDDELVMQAKIVALRRRTTLSRLIEDALRDVVAEPEPTSPKGFDLPVADGGGFPEGFPFHSGSLMLELLEGPDART